MIVLVVAPYGEIRDSLTSLVSVIPEINIVSTTDSLDRGVYFVEEHSPAVAVLVLDDLDSEKLAKVKLMKEASPDLKTVAYLKNNGERVESVLGSTSEGEPGLFDAVVPQYARASIIRKTISTLVRATE